MKHTGPRRVVERRGLAEVMREFGDVLQPSGATQALQRPPRACVQAPTLDRRDSIVEDVAHQDV